MIWKRVVMQIASLGWRGERVFSGPHAQFLPHMPSFRYSWPASQLNPLFSLGLSPQLLDRLSAKQETKMKTVFFIVPLWFAGTFQGKLFIHDSKSLISWWVVWKQTALSGWSYVCSSSLLCLSKYHVWLSIIIIMHKCNMEERWCHFILWAYSSFHNSRSALLDFEGRTTWSWFDEIFSFCWFVTNCDSQCNVC